ncbi:hypothetical protein [Chlamydia vaughanii]|uniref:hypothetical protein n=1 Tax=Chlamydia vaughanii TaxID=3112552 RepID=UPI0032B1000D
MSSVSGTSGGAPNPNPIPGNNRTDGAGDNQDNTGVTSSGERVEVTSTGGVNPTDPAGNQAAAVSAVAAPILDADSRGASALPPSSDAAAVVAGAVESASEPSQEVLAEELDLTEAEIQNFAMMVGTGLNELGSAKLSYVIVGGYGSLAPQLSPEEAAERLAYAREQYQEILTTLTDLETKSTHLTSKLGDMHKSMSGLSIEAFERKFGKRAQSIMGSLEFLGLGFEGDGWKIDPRGAIPLLSNQLREFSASVANLELPGTTREEAPATTPASVEEAPATTTPTSEVISRWDSFLNRMRTLLHEMVERFQILYDRLLFCFFWIINKVRDLFGRSDSEGDSNEDPFGYGGDTRL